MEGKRQALILWLQAITNTEISELRQLRDGKLLAQVISMIDDLPITSSSKDHSERNKNYNQLKTIYQHVMSIIQKNSVMNIPELSYLNLIKMAQGE